MKHIHVLEQRAAASLDLGTVSDADLQALPGMEFSAAKASGRYDFDHQVAFCNQYWNG